VCTFHAWTESRPGIVWPAAYREWAASQNNGLNESFDEALMPPPHITSPVSGSVYFVDPRLGPSADIRVSALDVGVNARWSLDGRTLPARDASFFWTPVPGEHVIAVEAPSGSDQVRFSVR